MTRKPPHSHSPSARGGRDRERRRSGHASSLGPLSTDRALERDESDVHHEAVVQGLLLHPHLYRKQIVSVSPASRPGDLLRLRDEHGITLGFGIFNPKSERRVRVVCRGSVLPAGLWDEHMQRAVEFRRAFLRLDAVSDAYRVVHAEADELSGLVVDRYGDVLSAEVYAPGMFQRAPALLKLLQSRCDTRHYVVRCAPQAFGQEGFGSLPIFSDGCPESTTVTENGVRFRVGFVDGHKTGFFCDQRENRRDLAALAAGKEVLDLCCYSGGFALAAAVAGKAASVTGIDLDETAIEAAKKNAHLNRATIRWTHADAFGWMRDALVQQRQYDVVVLDPPKLIHHRADVEEGRKIHFDLNRLAMQLVRRGGIFLTCTCSGLLAGDEFQKLVCAAARQAGDPLEEPAPGKFARRGPREVKIFRRSGAAADHPVSVACPETEYLTAIWCRMES